MSCQKLGLYKLASLSKKKLQAKNKKLRAKLKTKDTGKNEAKAQLKVAVKKLDYWENKHAELDELVAGVVIVHT